MPSYAEIYRRWSKPLEPLPTGQQPVLRPLAGIRAVLFDIYGTLFVSGSGDVGFLRSEPCEQAVEEAFRAVGLKRKASGKRALELFWQRIEQLHAASRAKGVEYPEVDIVQVWQTVIGEVAGTAEGTAAAECPGPLVERLAVEFEVRANPVWPMPGAGECLDRLRHRGLVLGLVSNAQFYTREMFAGLLGRAVEDWGFDPDLQYYSFRHGVAKPGPELFRMAIRRLRRRGIGPEETVFVGNDMLKDVAPAAGLGMRTALFAGDARSLRRREGDPRVERVVPDLVLTQLFHLHRCILDLNS